MNKIFRFSVLLLAALMVLGLVGCETDDGGGDGGGGGGEIDYTNYVTNFSIKVKNDTNHKLVAFKGPPREGTLISGIPTGGAEHGLYKDTALFSTSGDFILWLITEEDYLANKNNLAVLDNRPFTRIYAVYNTNSPNQLIYRISSILGGNKRIILQNNTAYNVELRNDAPYNGPTIGYTLRETYNTTFNVEAGSFMVFPVFRKYDSFLNEIRSAYPLYGTGSPLAGRVKFVTFSLDNETSEWTIDANAFCQGITISAGAAFLNIQNNHSLGMSLWDGEVLQQTEAGGDYINPNRDLNFPVRMPVVPGGGEEGLVYQASVTKAQYRIGTPAYRVQIPSFEYENGKIYKIEITGSGADQINLSAIEFKADWEF